MTQQPFEMPQYVVDRIMNKRGRLHVFEALEPERNGLRGHRYAERLRQGQSQGGHRACHHANYQ